MAFSSHTPGFPSIVANLNASHGISGLTAFVSPTASREADRMSDKEVVERIMTEFRNVFEDEVPLRLRLALAVRAVKNRCR